MRSVLLSILFSLILLPGCSQGKPPEQNNGYLLNVEDFRSYVDYFNRMEDENIIQAIPCCDSAGFDIAIVIMAINRLHCL